jgi:hypothetical protein
MITSTSITPLKSLHIADLKVLARYHGPCVTIQLPSYHPGAGGGTRLAHLRQLTQAAADGLRKLNWPEKADLVVAAIEELLHTLPLESGGPGLTLFCAPRFEAAYETPGIDTEEVTVGSRFHLLPQLIAAQAPQVFFILGISQKRLRLFRYHQGRCDEMALPASVPASLAAAGSFDKPDHTQESRSAGGPSVGSMRGVRFGTSSDHDSEGEYLRHFFEQVDKGLKETLDGAPLFLAGVQEELALYRKTAKHAQILGAEYLRSTRWRKSPARPLFASTGKQASGPSSRCPKSRKKSPAIRKPCSRPPRPDACGRFSWPRVLAWRAPTWPESTSGKI